MTKQPILVGELISQDGFTPPVKKILTKTWWEEFVEFIRSIIGGAALVGCGWLLNEILRMVD